MTAAATTPPTARRTLILLVVLAGAMLALAIFQRDRALQQAYEDAQDRAELYAGTVLRSALSQADVAGPLEGQARDDLFAEVQGLVLTDPTVARVRIWDPEGTLLFSTDPADQPGDTSEDPAIDVAAGGRAESRITVEDLSRSTVEKERVSTPLFQTFAPLRVQDDADVRGAAEVEHFAAEIEERADDPWWLVQTVATVATALLALMALVSVARGMRRPAPVTAGLGAAKPSRRRRGRKGGGWDEDVGALRERLERVTSRAHEAEEAAQSFATRLQEVTQRLESVERKSPDERVEELKEALRRSEAERAMLRSGRPETLLEAQVRELRRQLGESQALARAAEALVAGGGDLSAVKDQLSTAAHQVESAAERARAAEGRADAAEEHARSAGDMATAAEARIDMLETKLQEIVASGVPSSEAPGLEEVQAQLADADARVEEMERRAAEAETQLAAAAVEAPADALLQALEERVLAAEARSAEAETRLRAFENEGSERESVFRRRLGLTASGRKVAVPAPTETVEPGPDPDADLWAAIARGLRAPLTRASGLTLSLAGSVESGEAKSVLRQLSTSLRRLDRLAADLHDVHRIADGSLPLRRRRTDLEALVRTTLEEADHVEERLVRLDADRVSAVVDPDRVRQIVEGMLEAARDRTRAGAAIVVRVRSLETGARISVEDDNGTPARVGPEISLAARLAELHGTEITAEGSSLRVLFPRDQGLDAP
jgi:hypothetical protein